MNPQIERQREMALSILKPSARDLERGLQLHSNSLVIESYSLGLNAPVDTEALNQATEAGASDPEYQDLVEGMIMTRWSETDALREEYREAWEASGVNCTFLNAGEEGNQPLQLIKRLARYVSLCDAMPDFLGRVSTARSIEDFHRANRRAICLTLNGVPLTGNLSSVPDEMRYIRVFAQLGARMMHLTYNRRNPLGDGCGELRDGGLSDFGLAVVGEMNRLGVIIDLAHTGWQTCLDAARASNQPLVVSHSGAWELGRHARCKTDEVIRAVVDTGGTMGITNVPQFLGGKGDISTMLDHVDYVIKKFGVEAVTIGTDRSYRSRESADSEQKLSPRLKKHTRWEGLRPPGQEVHMPEWRRPEQVQSLAWTNWPLFTVGLVQRGYSDEDIAKIIGGNLLRVVRQVWK